MTLDHLLDTFDPQGMYAAVGGFPDHLEEGWARGGVAESFGLDAFAFDGLVVCGMGGSAIGGDLVRTFAAPTARLPFVVNRGYDLPGWVDERTLVVASSYSGGTEETLSAFAEARARGATLAVVASGGELLERADADDLPRIVIPGGLQPRAALGYSLGVLLRFGRALRLYALDDGAFDTALSEARARGERLAHAGHNPAVDFADALRGRFTVVYSGAGLLDAVNLRWQTQLHENAKALAYGNLFPELNHNEIMGFEAAPPDLLGRMAVVVLRDAEEHPQVQRRIEITRGLVAPRVALWHEVQSEGTGRLSRMLSLVQLGDWVSFWLAMRAQLDPTPVETIQALKRALAG